MRMIIKKIFSYSNCRRIRKKDQNDQTAIEGYQRPKSVNSAEELAETVR